jgi:hypothetical protein
MAEPHTDPVKESRRLIETATSKGVTVRAIGGVAVQLRSPAGGPILPRKVGDIDLVTKRGTRTAVTNLLVSAGCSSTTRSTGASSTCSSASS